MPETLGSLVRHPARVSFLWYASAIVIGSILLSLPVARQPDRDRVRVLDATFTATSAVCVTGLAVRSTGNDFSRFGQAVILVLIQLGGIGIMTVTTFVTLTLGGRQDLRLRAILTETLGKGQEPDLRWVLKRVISFTLLFELTGFAVLFLCFWREAALSEAAWSALFHSISAFCNAGFSLYDDSLMRYRTDAAVNLIIMVLIVSGGLGFPVMMDLTRRRSGSMFDRWNQLTLHSKLILAGTLFLIVSGTVTFFTLEYNGVLHELSLPQKILVSTFHSVTCRTAGFNTSDLGALTNATLFISILLMAIGAGPCSTAGGFKVSTLAVLALRGWSTLRGRARVTFSRRTIPSQTADRAIATALLFAVVAIFALTFLLVVEQSETPHAQSQGLFMDALFEIISALGTVGLSTGMTPFLTTAGRIIVIVLMFMGRLGPISVFAALSWGTHRESIEYVEEGPLIG